MVLKLDQETVMVLDLLLPQPILGRLVQPRRRNCIPAANAYPKVLKHLQLGMFQIRTVSPSTGRGSLGKEMGKLLGKSVHTRLVGPKCSQAIFTHLIVMPASVRCDRKPCQGHRPSGVSL